MARFSVIVPCFNLSPWIEECLESMLSQTYADWECIVVDDESTDESSSILDGYAARDVRIKVIHHKNRGEGGARNAGLSAATGEWVVFLDGDDVLAEGALGMLAAVIAGNPRCSLIRFGFREFQDGEGCEGLSSGSSTCVVKDISREIAMPDFFTYAWQHAYWNEWHRCVGKMRCAKGLSARAKLIYCIGNAIPCRTVWWLLLRALPWYLDHGLIPRGRRMARRMLSDCRD